MLFLSASEQGRGIKAQANLASVSSILKYIMLQKHSIIGHKRKRIV